MLLRSPSCYCKISIGHLDLLYSTPTLYHHIKTLNCILGLDCLLSLGKFLLGTRQLGVGYLLYVIAKIMKNGSAFWRFSTLSIGCDKCGSISCWLALSFRHDCAMLHGSSDWDITHLCQAACVHLKGSSDTPGKEPVTKAIDLDSSVASHR